MKTRIRKILLICLIALLPAVAHAQINARVFDLIDLGYPGLERTAERYRAGDIEGAAAALLDYYRGRTSVIHPDIDLGNVTITEEHRRWADNGLRHIFFVHDGYQPSCFYGDDIDWRYWPVKDNELRWQLHRTKWWVPMGKAYRVSGDEKYAKEWMLQYVDWIEKNPLIEETEHQRAEVSSGDIRHSIPADEREATLENVRFAWRPLEVSDRLEFQIRQFAYFISSPSITPEFLTRFLMHYHRQADYITRHFSWQGNHLLFEAQRLTYAGVFFPEFRDAPSWRAKGVEILNREIRKQVYDDGMQYELDPHYHLEAINIFFNALRMMDANGYRNEFPQSYLDTMEGMIVIYYNITFPDYTNPAFSDAKLHDRDFTWPYYRKWAEVFPENGMIRWLATEGRDGKPEPYLSRTFKTSGMYVLRNGWARDATVMVLKAGPPAFWHNQPDNGTFELWRKGRNFFPDSGSYVYGGDEQIMELRNWFRQTRVHNTLTLDGRDIKRTDSRCVYRNTGERTDAVAVVNPGYENLTHRRTVFFVNRAFFVIADEAYGTATGEVELNYHLAQGSLTTEPGKNYARTTFGDGNNLSLRVFADRSVSMVQQQGWVSHAYRQRNERPWLVFAAAKSDPRPVRFITVIAPAEGDSANDTITASFAGEFDPDGLHIRVEQGSRTHELQINYDR